MLLSFQPKQIIIESTCDFDHGFAFVSLVESVVHATKNDSFLLLRLLLLLLILLSSCSFGCCFDIVNI